MRTNFKCQDVEKESELYFHEKLNEPRVRISIPHFNFIFFSISSFFTLHLQECTVDDERCFVSFHEFLDAVVEK
jgi:hypothetical protein